MMVEVKIKGNNGIRFKILKETKNNIIVELPLITIDGKVPKLMEIKYYKFTY